MFGVSGNKLLQKAVPVETSVCEEDLELFWNFVKKANAFDAVDASQPEEICDSHKDEIHPQQIQDSLASSSTFIRRIPCSTQTPANFSSRTPRKYKLRAVIGALEMKIKEQEEEIKKLQSINSTEQFLEAAQKSLPQELYSLVNNYVANSSVPPKGRRYGDDIKQFASTINYLSPAAYNYIQEPLLLPSSRTLQKITETWPNKPGISQVCLSILKHKFEQVTEFSKHCIICLDEMTLKAHLFYDKNNGEIIGFQDDGITRQNCTAKNVLVIMARGIAENWKQPLGYIFVHTVCPPFRLKQLLSQTVQGLLEIGFKPQAVVSDQGANFRALARILSVTKSDPTFKLHDTELVYIFDSPHLIKSIRNNLMKYDMQFDGNKCAKWSDIVNFYNWDSKRRFRLAPKLSPSHINPGIFEKMKVKTATQVLSKTVACGIYTQVSLAEAPASAIQTAEFIETFDNLFDMVNSSKPSEYKQHKKPFSGTNFQVEELRKFRTFLESIVVKSNGKNVTNSIHCLNGLLVTLTGIEKLWENLEKAGFKFLLTRRINQDCLEHLFATIRKRGGNNLHPTPIQFKRAFKKLISFKYFEIVKSGNCELQRDFASNPFPHVFSHQQELRFTGPQVSVPNPLKEMDLGEMNAFEYFAGYMYKELQKDHECGQNNEASTSCQSTYIMFRTIDTCHLTMPPNEFVAYLKILENKFVEGFNNLVTDTSLGKKLLETLSSVPPYKCCPLGNSEFLLHLFLRVRIYFVIKFYNREIKDSNNKNKLLSVQSL